MSRHDPCCDHCHKHRGKAVKSYKLEPRNWEPRYRLLCAECRGRLGFAPISHDRPYVGMHAQRLM